VSRAAGQANETLAPQPAPEDPDAPHTDELAAYLALPQIAYTTEWDALEWWEKNAKRFPNLSVMARQYLSCPATSASVERPFSVVGNNFSKKRKSANADTLAAVVFTQINVK